MYELFLAGTKLPVLPENLKEQRSRDNKKYHVLNLGDVIAPGKAGLKQWTISSVFYGDEAYSPQSYRDHLNQLLESDAPFELILNRFNEDGSLAFQSENLSVLMESLAFEDKEGEPGTLYFTVKLVEYRPFGAVVV